MAVSLTVMSTWQPQKLDHASITQPLLWLDNTPWSKKTDPLTLCHIALSFHNVFSQKSTKCLRKLGAVNSNLIRVPLVYAVDGTLKKQVPASRLLCTHPTFSQSVMVSVGVSALGRTSIHFVEPGVNANGQYYREVLLKRNLLPDIHQLSDYFHTSTR